MNFPLILMIVSSFLSQLTFAATRSPTTEIANYQLDKSSSRTTSIVKDGSVSMGVVGQSPYKLKITYRLKLSVGGNRQGDLLIDLPEGFFEGEFMDKLRRDGHFETSSLKIDHLGYSDVTTLDGHSYAHCDIVKIYDIVLSKETKGLFKLLKDLSGDDLAAEEDFKDISIVGAVYPGIPVLGAVKVDLAGKYLGVSVRAGGDYVSP